MNYLEKQTISSIAMFLFTVITACSQTKQITENSTLECPSKPKIALKSSNVKPILLNNQTIIESGMASTTKLVGYSVEAKSGQKLSYKTNENLCIWIYTPDNQILTTPHLPITGKYLIQIATPKGATTFDLSMNIENLSTLSNGDMSASDISRIRFKLKASQQFNITRKAINQIIKNINNEEKKQGLPQTNGREIIEKIKFVLKVENVNYDNAKPSAGQDTNDFVEAIYQYQKKQFPNNLKNWDGMITINGQTAKLLEEDVRNQLGLSSNPPDMR